MAAHFANPLIQTDNVPPPGLRMNQSRETRLISDRTSSRQEMGPLATRCWRPGRQRLTRPQVALFCRQLAGAMEAGLTALEALSVLRRSPSPAALQEAAGRLGADIEAGRSMGEALARQTGFPAFVSGAVRAAEVAGAIPSTLRSCARQLEAETGMRRRLGHALMYPALLASLMLATVAVIRTAALPALAEVLREAGGDLPAVTRAFFTIADYRPTGLQVTTAGVVLLFVAATRRTATGRYWWEMVLGQIPVAGGIVRRAVLVLFIRALLALVEGACPVYEAVTLAARSSGSNLFVRRMERAREYLVSGQPLADALAATGLFPPLFLAAVGSAERTETLPETLACLADHYEEEHRVALAVLVGAIGPALTVIGGAGILFVALAVVIPLQVLLPLLN